MQSLELSNFCHLSQDANFSGIYQSIIIYQRLWRIGELKEDCDGQLAHARKQALVP